MSLIYHCEYNGAVRTAHVYKEENFEQWVVLGYKANHLLVKEYFPRPKEAEKYAEDWVKS